VISELLPHAYDNTFNLLSVDSISRGDTALFMVTLYITEPATPIELGVFQPLGFDVRFFQLLTAFATI